MPARRDRSAATFAKRRLPKDLVFAIDLDSSHRARTHIRAQSEAIVIGQVVVETERVETRSFEHREIPPCELSDRNELGNPLQSVLRELQELGELRKGAGALEGVGIAPRFRQQPERRRVRSGQCDARCPTRQKSILLCHGIGQARSLEERRLLRRHVDGERSRRGRRIEDAGGVKRLQLIVRQSSVANAGESRS